VPRDRSPPTIDPDSTAWIVALLGKLPGEPVGTVPPPELVVDGDPDFGGYAIPEEGQLPACGASIGTNTPSITEPFRWKYHWIAFKVLPVHSRAGVNPDWAFRAALSWDKVNVLLVVGVIPALDRNVKVGSVWKSLTTVWKKATASAPLTLPLGKQLGSRVLIQVPWVAHSCSQNCSFCPLISTQCVCMKAKVELAPLLVSKVLMPV